MKKLFYLTVFASLLACGEKNPDSEKASSIELTYEIDTVMVDAGEHFFFLNWGLGIADVSADRKLLYNLNPQTLVLEVVDLDGLALKETIQLEKEGPNGVGGGFVSRLQVLENGNLMLFDFNKIIEINPAGDLLKSYEFNANTLTGYEFGETDKVSYSGLFSPDGKIYVGEMVDDDFKAPSKGLALINIENMELKFVATDASSKLDEFRIMLEMDTEGGTSSMSMGESVFIRFMEDQLVVSNSALNEAYIYNIVSDTLVYKTFEATLTGNERIKNFPNQVDSREALFEASKEKQKQVRFGPMIPQTEENLIWRFSTDMDRMIADSVVSKDVVTLFDTDFNMLEEQTLENFTNSSSQFFKDGMLYSYLNINDEMAFVRLKPQVLR